MTSPEGGATLSRLKSLQDPKAEGQSVNHEEVCSTLRKLCKFCDLYKHKNMAYVWQ